MCERDPRRPELHQQGFSLEAEHAGIPLRGCWSGALKIHPGIVDMLSERVLSLLAPQEVEAAKAAHAGAEGAENNST